MMMKLFHLFYSIVARIHGKTVFEVKFDVDSRRKIMQSSASSGAEYKPIICLNGAMLKNQFIFHIFQLLKCGPTFYL